MQDGNGNAMPTDDISNIPKFNDVYHERQWTTCYESTRCFYDFLDKHGALNSARQTIVDLCSGSGANLYWLNKRRPELELIGVEIAPELVDIGNSQFAHRGVEHATMVQGDVYKLDAVKLPKADGVIAIQTVSWLPDEVAFIKSATALDSDWIALTGLMIDGSHTFRTVINDHADQAHGVNYYNTFSIEYLTGLLAAAGYTEIFCEPFNIELDLPRPKQSGLGTYTENTTDGRRLQISGALLMNWHFLLARRK